ncbi:unnamed protein product, partial [Adineta steineri]
MYKNYLYIINHRLLQLLRTQTKILLTNETNVLLTMPNSPYIIHEDGISIFLSSYKWNNFVYGAFKLDVIEKSLKYYSTTMFSLYCRLCSFNPFYYESSYPTLNIFKYSYLLEPRPLSVEEYTFFKIFGNNQKIPEIDNNLNHFIQNFTCRYEYDVWGQYVDWNSFIIAGGSVVSSLLVHHSTRNGSDIDLFFLKENLQLFKNAVNELELRLQNTYFIQRKIIWLDRLVQFDLFRKFTMQDILNGHHFTPSVIIQLIRPTITPITISRILHSFDLDICAAAFNSNEVIISFSCLQALKSGYTTCYDIPISPSKFVKRAIRFHKYQQRGFSILCPKDFDVDAFFNTIVKDCKQIPSERTYRFRTQQFG